MSCYNKKNREILFGLGFDPGPTLNEATGLFALQHQLEEILDFRMMLHNVSSVMTLLFNVRKEN